MKIALLSLAIGLSTLSFGQRTLRDMYFNQVQLHLNYSNPLDGNAAPGLGINAMHYFYTTEKYNLYFDFAYNLTGARNLDSAAIHFNSETDRIYDVTFYWHTISMALGYRRIIYGPIGGDFSAGWGVGTGTFNGEYSSSSGQIERAGFMKGSSSTWHLQAGLFYSFKWGKDQITIGANYRYANPQVGKGSVDSFRNYYPYGGPTSSYSLSIGYIFCDPPEPEEERMDPFQPF
ncbi:MAG: hypothetical protein HWE14_02745 [Flavobacteriia bacterium]|nr:hypothetical protein [Flavobacteriia bacterium]